MTPQAPGRTHVLVTAALLGLAMILRFYGIGWGLPQVYEEATPFKTAWQMWGWGPSQDVDLNPHFFNYPSLVIYLQFAVQGLAYLVLNLWGWVDSTLDYQVRYHIDKTTFYLVARTAHVLFGAACAWVTYLVGRRAAGTTVGVIAGALLAVNTFHISRSQMIEVDGPLTFFVVLSLLLMLRVVERPSLGRYVALGVCIGLAASTKYTGALLLLPAVVAHVTAGRGDGVAGASGDAIPGWRDASWWRNVMLLPVIAFAVFAITSPYVIIDFSQFMRDFNVERLHMRTGHFGVRGASWSFYAAALTGRLAGWPVALAGVAGLIYFAAIKRRPWALIAGSFLIPYLIAVGSWAMQADRYLLPVIPIIALFATALAAEIASRVGHNLRAPALGTVAILFALPQFLLFPEHLLRTRPDTRTLAKAWIEAHIPSGSFLVSEAYGPVVFAPQELVNMEPSVRRRVLELIDPELPNYAMQPISMYQIGAERSAVFYNLSLYAEIADAIITTDAVRSRYEREPERFPRQVAFYDSLEATFEMVKEFVPNQQPGPRIRIYDNPRFTNPFAARRDQQWRTIMLERPAEGWSGAEDIFYYNLGLNFEAFGFNRAAIKAYESAFRYDIDDPVMYKGVMIGKIRCLLRSGRESEAMEYLRSMIQIVPDAGLRADLESLLYRLRQRESGQGN